MQTFLPYKDFERSARVLDWRRLGKQRVETLQIVNALMNETKGWRNHPATLMWEGYEYQLCRYGLYMCKEWKARGYNPGVTQPKLMKWYKVIKAHPDNSREMPWWMGRKSIHQQHRRLLVWKAPEFYLGKFKDVTEVPKTKPVLWWPVVF